MTRIGLALAIVALAIQPVSGQKGHATTPKPTVQVSHGPSVKPTHGSTHTTSTTHSTGTTKTHGPSTKAPKPTNTKLTANTKKSTTTTKVSTKNTKGGSAASTTTAKNASETTTKSTKDTKKDSTTTTTTTTATPATTTTMTKAQQQLAKNQNLAAKLQSRLPAGTDLQKAAGEFRTLGQFVAAVNVSHNLGIPFADLKTAMTGPDAMSLGQAIQKLRPAMNGEVEADRADHEASVIISDSERTRDTDATGTTVPKTAKKAPKPRTSTRSDR